MIDQRVSEEKELTFLIFSFDYNFACQLAIKYKLKIVPVFIEREKITSLGQFFNEINSDDYKDKSILTKKLNEFIENMLVKNPNEGYGL